MNSSITESVGLATLPSQGPFLGMSGPLGLCVSLSARRDVWQITVCVNAC